MITPELATKVAENIFATECGDWPAEELAGLRRALKVSIERVGVPDTNLEEWSWFVRNMLIPTAEINAVGRFLVQLGVSKEAVDVLVNSELDLLKGRLK